MGIGSLPNPFGTTYPQPNYDDDGDIISNIQQDDEIVNEVTQKPTQEDLPFNAKISENKYKFKLPRLDYLKTPTKAERNKNQTDDNISMREFNKLPPQFTEWYSINVDFNNEKLHPIPLGISNGYEKNLSLKDQFQLDESRYSVRKKNLLYLSFADNTNIRVRSGLKTHFSKYSWTKIINGNNDLPSYKQDLKSSNFILCPEGNGIDTHRIWEALLTKTVPIIKKSHFSDNFLKLGLPFLLIEDWHELEKFDENWLITKDSTISFEITKPD